MSGRPDTLPWSVYYYNHPPMYLQPAQSRYHNLGQNGFIPHGAPYPGKRGGMQGDYGPVQHGFRNRKR